MYNANFKWYDTPMSSQAAKDLAAAAFLDNVHRRAQRRADQAGRDADALLMLRDAYVAKGKSAAGAETNERWLWALSYGEKAFGAEWLAARVGK